MSKTPSKAREIPTDLGYLEIPSGPPEGWKREESFKEKLIRKTKVNPLVPIGLGVTIFALSFGLYQMKTGNRAMSQKMMRLRVGAQAFTVLAIVGGVWQQAHSASAETTSHE